MKKGRISVPILDRVAYDPSRLAILTILYHVEKANFRYLQKKCVFTAGNLSRHLSKLEAAGYIAIAKRHKGKFPITKCGLTRKGREALERLALNISRGAGRGDREARGAKRAPKG